MKKVTLNSIKLENYKTFCNLIPGKKEFACNFEKVTRISGRNREGKTTIRDAWFDVLTGKMADGSQPDKIRPHDENGVDFDRIDIIRELSLEIDGKPVTVTKKTAQKWRKPRGQADEVFDGNVTTYSTDGFEQKQKEFQEWQESIADPDVLLMCSNARPFLNTVQKSTSEARKILERMSGFKIEDFVARNPEYAQIEEITKGHAIEDALKQQRKNLNAQKKAADTVRTQLTYEKDRDVLGSDGIPAIQESISEYKRKIAELDEQERGLNDVISAYDQKSKDLLDLRIRKSDIISRANEGLTAKKEEIRNIILSLKQQKGSYENELRLAEMDLKHANMGIERHSAEVKKAQNDWTKCSGSEYSDENLERIKAEQFDNNALICPTCGQDLPEEQAEKIRADFERKKAKRIEEEKKAQEDFYRAKDNKLQEIVEDGNKAAADLKVAKGAKAEAEEKILETKKAIAGLALEIAGKEKELSELPESVDLSNNKEYQQVSNGVMRAEEALKQMDNGFSRQQELSEQRNAYIRESAKLESEIGKIQSSVEDHERRVEELERKLRDEGQKCADIERKIDLLMDFSIQKNKALADKINPYFRSFQFVFYDFTQEGGIYETLKLVCDGTDYFGGLNGGDQRLVELDLCRGLQKINGLCLPIWLDESNTIDSERIPQDLAQQLICLERADCDLKVERLEW